jgi:plasmid stabilization system protein ParE
VTAKPVVPRALANRDIDDAIAYYLGEGTEQAAFGFIDAVEQACARIGRHPASGSPRYAHELNLPGLRFWPLARYRRPKTPTTVRPVRVLTPRQIHVMMTPWLDATAHGDRIHQSVDRDTKAHRQAVTK